MEVVKESENETQKVFVLDTNKYKRFKHLIKDNLSLGVKSAI